MIGVFDSGIGGLTVVKEIKKRLPDCPVVYFGDTARCPWGNKSPDLIKKYADEITSFLIGQGIKDIVIACNTASTFTGDYLKEKYSAINFYDVIDPVVQKVKKEKDNSKNEKVFSVGIIGTRGTIESEVYDKKIGKIDSKIKIYSKACPLFVSLAEEGMVKHEVTKIISQEYLQELKNRKLDALVLGCTHYPIIKDAIRDVMGDTLLIDSVEEVAKMIVEQKHFRDMKKREDIYYFSDMSSSFRKLVEDILGKEVVMRKMIF